MSKAVRTLRLASSALMLCASGSRYLGERRELYESRYLLEWMEGRAYVSQFYPETNIWQVAGVVLFFAGISVALAALMLR